jgi:uncharacterized UBP type Zn finger protein
MLCSEKQPLYPLGSSYRITGSFLGKHLKKARRRRARERKEKRTRKRIAEKSREKGTAEYRRCPPTVLSSLRSQTNEIHAQIQLTRGKKVIVTVSKQEMITSEPETVTHCLVEFFCE